MSDVIEVEVECRAEGVTVTPAAITEWVVGSVEKILQNPMVAKRWSRSALGEPVAERETAAEQIERALSWLDTYRPMLTEATRTPDPAVVCGYQGPVEAERVRGVTFRWNCPWCGADSTVEVDDYTEEREP